mgnify:CR=1 FL=1|jgi:hypothetical protein
MRNWIVYKHTSPSGKVYIRIISVENNNITHDFPSILVASKLLNVPTTSIGRHLRSGKPYKGYLYKYKDE